MPRFYSRSNEQEKLRRHISPPPLKRQRTGDACLEHKYNGHVGAFLLPSSPGHDSIARSNHDQTLSPHHHDQHKSSPGSATIQQSILPSLLRNESENGSRRSDATSSSTRTSTQKLKCRMCGRGKYATYDPIVLCISCSRQYHDSCRNPPLPPGHDPQFWTCYKCLAVEKHHKPNAPVARKSFGSDSFTPVLEEKMAMKSVQPDGTGSQQETQPIAFKNNTMISLNSLHQHTARTFTQFAPISLDGCGEEDSGGRNSFLQTSMPAKDRPIDARYHHEDGAGEFASTGAPIDFSLRAEVPNTPTQRSSQLFLSSSVPEHQPAEPVDEMLDAKLSNLPRIVRSKTPTVLCSTCRMKWVQRAIGSGKPSCRSCRQASTAEQRRLIIPETPDSINIQDSAVDSSVSTAESTSHGPESVSIAPVPALKASSLNFDWEGIVKVDPHVKSNPDVSDTNQGKCNARLNRGRATIANEVGLEQTRKAKIHLRNHAPLLQTSNNGPIQQVPPSRACASSIGPCNMMEINTKSETLDTSEAISVSDKARPISIGQRKSKPRSQNGSFTARQLATMAIVAADGTRWTAVQVITWLASTIPYLEKGKGSWEARVRAALSNCKEFNSQNMPSSRRRGTRKVYGFSSAEHRARCDQEYPQYCASSRSVSSTTSRSPSLAPKTIPSTPEESIDTTANGQQPGSPHRPLAFQQVLASKPKQKPNTQVLNMQVGEISPQEPADQVLIKNGRNMPFERAKPLGILDVDISAKCIANYFNAMTQDESLLEVLSESQKQGKIAEIKARPSRKQFFGSDYRLAHKRRLGLRSIHDERHGAWMPRRSIRDSAVLEGAESEVDKDDRNRKALRDLFDLPQRAIPMNDGQSELAFRDGTLVNGRLPRPRHIYKVGKLLGGELTIRAS